MSKAKPNKVVVLLFFACLSLQITYAQKNIRLKADTLKERTKVLDEVVVDGNHVVSNGNKTSYLPTKKQRNASHNGVDLLFHLNVPQLNVNPIAGSVSATDDSNVSIYLDGRKTTLSDIKNLRAKDVLRVEYYENALDLFPGEQKVLNYVMINYTSGGYVDLAADTRFISKSGAYKAQVSLDKNRMNYQLLTGAGYSRDGGVGILSHETVDLETKFEKVTTPTEGVVRKRNWYGLFRTTYKAKESQFFGQASCSYNRTPENSMKSLIEYSPEVYKSSQSTSKSNDKGLSLSGILYYYKLINKKHRFTANVSYSYSNNSYQRDYLENTSDESIRNDTKEDMHNLNAQFKLSMKLSGKSSLAFLVWDVLRSSHADYLNGSSSNGQKLLSNNFIFYPTYQIVWRNFTASVQAGFNYSYQHVNDEYTTEKINFRPRLTLGYQINRRSRLSFDAGMGSSTPSLSKITAAEQRVNYYETLRGNPELGTTTVLDFRLTHNLNMNKFRLSSFANFSGYLDAVQNTYVPENNILIHSYVIDGDCYFLRAGTRASFSLFKKALTVTGGITFTHGTSTGLYRAHSNNLSYSSSAIYYYRQLYAFMYYNSRMKYLQTSPCYVENPSDYGLAIGWNNRGWHVEGGMKRMFSNISPTKSSYTFAHYQYDRRSYSDSYGKVIYIKLSYSFDFGRTVKHEKLDIEPDAPSGILRI